jgi:hypothetical protein
MTCSSTWLSLLEDACTQAGTHFLHLIIDQSGRQSSLLPSVRSVEPPMLWHSLFTGLPEEGELDIAPLLVRVDLTNRLQKHWLLGLMQALHGQSLLLALITHWRFDDLSQRLTQCVDYRHGEDTGVFRYYDPRLFSLLFTDVLQEHQRAHWLQPAVLWSWLNLDGLPRHLPGTASPSDNAPLPGPVTLDDDQIEIISCVSDAFVATTALRHQFNPEWTPEQCFQASYAALRQASQTGLTSNAERQAFLLDRLGEA